VYSEKRPSLGFKLIRAVRKDHGDRLEKKMKTERPRPGQSGVVAFLHIPKTAGTTLNAILARQYAPDETHEIMMRGMSWLRPRPTLVPKPLISFSKIRRLKSSLRHGRTVRMIHGHFDLSIKRVLPDDVRLFTFLRDPVERAISHYYHYRRQTGDPVHPLAMSSTLEEWVGDCGLVEMDNGQTRRLAGEMNLPCGRVTQALLERAKSNLARNFAVVGLTERFEEPLILLQRAFGWALQRFALRNVGDNRPRRDTVSGETLKVLEDRNRYDADLYRFAAGLFDRAASQIDMAAELARLRALPERRRTPRDAIGKSVRAAAGYAAAS